MLLVTVRVVQGFSMGFRRQGAFFGDCPLVGVGDTKGDGPYRGEGFPQWGGGGISSAENLAFPHPHQKAGPHVSVKILSKIHAKHGIFLKY